MQQNISICIMCYWYYACWYYSKYAWAIPLKGKEGFAIAHGFQKVSKNQTTCQAQ